MVQKLILKREQWQAMRRHVRRRAPLEACGLLAGHGERVEFTTGIPNMDRSPVRFRMEPRAQWRAFQRMETAGLELIGIYHSHPSGPSQPSQTDIDECLYNVVQVIWSQVNGTWQGKAFSIETGKWIEIPVEIE